MSSSSDDSDVSSSYSSDGEIPCSHTKQCTLEQDRWLDFDDCVHRFVLLLSEDDRNKIVNLLHGEEESSNQSNIIPSEVMKCANPTILERVKSLATHRKGLVYINSPLVTFLQAEENIPNSAICDMYTFAPNHPCMVLTFVTDINEAVTRYNSCLARKLTIIAREKGLPHFQLVHGTIEEKEWSNQNGMDEKVRQLKVTSAKQQPGGRLVTDWETTKQARNLLLPCVQNSTVTTHYSRMFSTFVETSVYHAVRDKLQKEDILILTGAPGEGKTTIGHRLCYDYQQQGYNTVYYSRVQDINWEVVMVTKPTLVVYDNVNNNRNTFVNLLVHVKYSKSLKYLVLSQSKWHKCRVPNIDVTDMMKLEVQRTKRDQERMLDKLGLDIREEVQNEIISKLSFYPGFPKIVTLYRKYKQYVDPVTYFTYPLHYFIEEMENMAELSHMQEWVYLLLCGGGFNTDSNFSYVYGGHGYDRYHYSLSYESHGYRYSYAYADDKGEVLASMCHLFPGLRTTGHIPRTLLQYVSRFLAEEDNQVSFSHQAIYDACVFVVDRKYPSFLWKSCKVIFNREDEQSHVRLPELTVFISRQNTDLFLSQTGENLKQGKFHHSLSHGVLRSQENIERLFTQLNDSLKDIIHAEDDSKSFLYWVVKSKNQCLLKTVLDQNELIQTDVNKTLIDCIKLDQIEYFLSLREELINKDRQRICYQVDCRDREKNSLLMTAMQKHPLKVVKILIKDTCDLLLRNKDRNTALHLASLRGYTEIVKYILPKMGELKDITGQDCRTPVMMAALKGHGQLYEYLAEVEKCQLTGIDDNGDTILHLACTGGNLNIVKNVMSSQAVDKNQRGRCGKTPLMIAAHHKHRELFHWLLTQKCNISPCDFSITEIVSYGHTKHFHCLHEYLQSREHGNTKHHLKILPNKQKKHHLNTHLESKGSNMLFEDRSGTSVIHTAATIGNMDLANLLLSKGNTDIDIRDGSGKTPVMLAAAAGHEQMFDLLLKRGADLSLKDQTSSGILHFACQGGSSVIINRVMDRGYTDASDRNNVMKTPLSYIVQAGNKLIFDKMLNMNGDLSVEDRNKNTLLHLACKGGNLAIVEHLLSMGMFDIDAVNIKHQTPLLVAAYSGHTGICYDLICKGTDLHKQDQLGNDVLLVAADTRNTELTKYILKNCERDAYKKNKAGKSAPIIAAEKCHNEIFTELMEHSCFNLMNKKPDDKDISNLKPVDDILHAACTGGSIDIIQNILSLDIVDINSRDRRGRTPVMIAAENGHSQVFDLLVRKGCDLPLRDEYRLNILHAACTGGNVDIVQYILSRDIVDINSRDRRGRIPVMIAAENGHSQVFDLLVHKGCDLLLRDGYRSNILHAACTGGNVDIVQYIFSQDIVDINSRDRRGRTPVMIAAENGHSQVFDLLVRKGCDLLLRDGYRSNILHAACTIGSVDIVQYILSQDIVDINSRDRRGRTPVMIAAANGHTEVVELLVRKGCYD